MTGSWTQLKTVLWLRWRLSWNQWRRGGGLNAVLTVLAIGGGILLAAGGGAAGVLLGCTVLAKASARTLMAVWDGVIGAFLLFWLLGVITEIQRGESLDLARFLHLPVSIRQIFTINYLASHLTLSIAIFVPAMLGLGLGLVFSRGALFILVWPLVAAFIFMITAWTYCLRGWLAAIMDNPRRRRAIVAGLAIFMALVGQLPNFYFNVLRSGLPRRPHHRFAVQSRSENPKGADPLESLGPAAGVWQRVIPPLWLADGVTSLGAEQAWPALAGIAGGVLIGGLGLLRAYLTTIRYYQGGRTGKKRKKRTPRSSKPESRRTLIERNLPGVPEPANAMALTFFRSLSRAPEVKMFLFTPLIVLVVVGGMLLARHSLKMPPAVRPLAMVGAGCFPLLTLAQFLCNQFGFDRDGFRSLVLLPAPHRQILVAKNLATAPFACAPSFLLLTVVAIAFHASVLEWLAGLLQAGIALFFIFILSNWVSLMAPYRVASGTLKRPKMRAQVVLMALAAQLLMPLCFLPAIVPAAIGLLWKMGGGSPLLPLNLLLSVIFVAGAAWGYRLSLDPLGALLERREKRILEIVTQELE